MRILTVWLLLCCLPVFAQNPANKNQQSKVDIKGNSNVVKVYQTGILHVYNLGDKKQADDFLEYLQSLPGISQSIKEVLMVDKKILDLVTRLYAKTNDDGLFSPDKLLDRLEKYVRENENLRIENETLRKKTLDPDFSLALMDANKKLEQYDNEGYQEILEAYKIKKNEKILSQQKEVAFATYLQASNNWANYKVELALEQIQEALKFDVQNVNYLLLKADIYYELYSFDTAVNIFKQVLPSITDDSLKAYISDKIATIYNNQGKYAQALVFNLQALSVWKKTVGEKNANTADCYNGLGAVYHNMRRFDSALYYHYKSLQIRQEIFSLDDLNTAFAYNSIGRTYIDMGDTSQALKIFLIALSIREKILGNQHPITANSYESIGLVYKNMHQYDKALEYFTKSLSIYISISDDFDAATECNLIGAIYDKKGDYNNALIYYLKCLDIKESFLDNRNPILGTYANNIGITYDHVNDYENSIKYFNKAQSIFKNAFGEEDYNLANTYNNIGIMYNDSGHSDSAIYYFEKALLIRRKVFGDESPVTVESYEGLADVYYSTWQYQKALSIYKIILSIGEKKHNVDIVYYLIAGLTSIKNGDKKEEWIKYLSKLNIDDRSKLYLIDKEAAAMFDKQKYAEAINLYNATLYYIEKDKDLKQSITLPIGYQNLAKSYCYNNDAIKASSLFQKALLLCQKFPDNPEVEKIKQNYLECQKR